MKKFNELTKYIPKLEGDNFGQWVIDEVNDGSPAENIRNMKIKDIMTL